MEKYDETIQVITRRKYNFFVLQRYIIIFRSLKLMAIQKIVIIPFLSDELSQFFCRRIHIPHN